MFFCDLYNRLSAVNMHSPIRLWIRRQVESIFYRFWWMRDWCCLHMVEWSKFSHGSNSSRERRCISDWAQHFNQVQRLNCCKGMTERWRPSEQYIWAKRELWFEVRQLLITCGSSAKCCKCSETGFFICCSVRVDVFRTATTGCIYVESYMAKCHSSRLFSHSSSTFSYFTSGLQLLSNVDVLHTKYDASLILGCLN